MSALLPIADIAERDRHVDSGGEQVPVPEGVCLFLCVRIVTPNNRSLA
jgi:hypothetical protein